MSSAAPTVDQDLQTKLNQLYESTVLGNYYPTARLEAIQLKFDEQVKKYRNKGIIKERELKESKITDPNERQLFTIQCKIEDLEQDVTEFDGNHYNLKYRQLKEQCVKCQLDLDNLRIRLHSATTDKERDLKIKQQREFHGKIGEIEKKLLEKMEKKVNHERQGCPQCN